MIANWILEATSIFFTTCGTLLIFLGHQRLRARLSELSSRVPEIVITHHRQLSAGLATISVSLVLQCVALIYL